MLNISRRISRACKNIRIRHLFIDTETTPNPHSLKFKIGRDILPETYTNGIHFKKEDFAGTQRSPLAKQLFGIEGVLSVFLAKEFLSITKSAEVPWHVLKPVIFSKILDFFSENRAVVEDKPLVTDTTILESDSEIVSLIKELLETRIRPSVQDDGGDIFYEGYDIETGMVKVRLAGSCVGCPSSSVTLRNGVENMLMHYIPEVKGIIEISQEADSTDQKLEFHVDPV